MKKTILLVDIGNTSVTMGIATGNEVTRKGSILTASSSLPKICGAIRSLTKGLPVQGAILSSVVPAKNALWTSAIRRISGVKTMVVTYKMNLGVAIDYPKPATIGADRLVNASAAVALYGTPAVIADFGTALTFDVINKKGAYCGGVIAPGLPLMMDYLYERTALLPRVAIEGSIKAYGRSTEDAMRIGTRIGYAGMVQSITGHIVSSLRGDVHLVATGGYAKLALSRINIPYVINTNLTLLGLVRIFNLNS